MPGAAAGDAAGPPAVHAEIVVSGKTPDASGPLSVGAQAPDGSLAPPVQVDPRADGRFEARVPASGPFWSGDGTYIVTVTQGGQDSPFVDVALVDVRGGAVVEAGRTAGAAAPDPQPRILSIGERWRIIDAVVLAEDGGAGQYLVVVGATDIAGRAVQAAVTALGGDVAVVEREAMPDASGAVVIEVPAGRAAWGPGAADGTHTLAVGQPCTRYLDVHPVHVSGGRVVAPAGLADAPVPLPANAYGSARLLGSAWTLVTRADVETAPDGSPGTVVVLGRTDRPEVPVAVRAEAPDGSPVLDARVAPYPDGSFEVRIDASGGEWAADGPYRIALRQGFEPEPPDLVIVEVSGGAVVPEFGAAAAAALATAVAAALAAAAAASPRMGLGPARPAA